MVVFLICMVAETNRAPFDLPEAENELIAGYHTEYSSMKFAVFFMGEYAAMFIFSAVMSVIFFGGWNIVPINWDYIAQNSSLPFFGGIAEAISGLNYWLAPLFFIGKIAFFISVYIWLRATLPRLRYDQLMSLGWKSLLPLATVNFIIVASWILVTRLVSETKNPFWGQIAGIGLWVVAAALVYSIWRIIKQMSPEPKLETRTVTLVDPRTANEGAAS
jgi:NADH-quinone oxidoreductase subunit H